MPKNRGPQERVYVPLATWKYGWSCNSVKFNAVKAVLGIVSATDVSGVTYGANSPKPPKASKIDKTSKETQSSFFDVGKTAALKTAGWLVVGSGRKRGAKLAGKSVTVYVDTPLLYKYAWNMASGDVAEAVKAGVVKATGTEKDLVWGSFPKPPRGYIQLSAGGFSTFVPPDAASVEAAVAKGFSVEGVDPDWGVAAATP